MSTRRKTATFSLRVSSNAIGRVRAFCKEKGFKIGVFIEQAVKEKLEREELLEDSRDVIRLRYEEPLATPMEDYFEKRGI